MPRYATLRTLYEPGSQLSKAQILDPNAIVLFFPAPKTVTGEDVLELHIHGGPAIVKAVLNGIPKALNSVQGNASTLLYAEPGEFTRRAFYNNRLDLTQIESLGDALSAETEQQRRLAVSGASNALSQGYESWRQQLLYARGELEALIDFSEDQYFEESPESLIKSVSMQVERLRRQLELSIQNSFRGELLRSGISVALVGAPNAGKSSLLNRIVQREASIVSKEEGTTRDVVEVGVDIGGFYCRFGDLAGLRENSEDRTTIREIEMEGMKRARAHAMAAHVVILVLSIEDAMTRVTSLVNPEVEATLKACDLDTQKVVCVVNKADLIQSQASRNDIILRLKHQSALSSLPAGDNLPIFVVSCQEAQAQTDLQDPGGLQSFLQGLVDVFKGMTSAITPQGQCDLVDASIWEQSLGANERQRLLLQQCLQCLETFLVEATFARGNHHETSGDENEKEVDLVLAAEHLRTAADCLAQITGKEVAGDVEEVLGVVFEK